MSSSGLLLDEAFRDFARHALAGVSQPGQRIIESTPTDDSWRGSMPFDNWTLALPLRFFLEGEAIDPAGGLVFRRATGSQLLDVYSGHGGDPVKFVSRFTAKFFEQLHTVICGEKLLERTTDYTAKGAATALATWIGQKAGVTEPIAIATAVVIIIILAEATKGAFCSLTKEEILDKLRRDDR